MDFYSSQPTVDLDDKICIIGPSHHSGDEVTRAIILGLDLILNE